jgi:regulator of RNase E activity RraA
MWGELFSCAAMGAGARGVVTDGLVRDVRQIVELGFPVFASGSSPLDTLGRAEVVGIGESVRCGGVPVARGDLVLGDDDGVVVVPYAAAGDVTARVREKLGKEQSGRDDLLAGLPVRQVWERYGVF